MRGNRPDPRPGRRWSSVLRWPVADRGGDEAGQRLKLRPLLLCEKHPELRERSEREERRRQGGRRKEWGARGWPGESEGRRIRGSWAAARSQRVRRRCTRSRGTSGAALRGYGAVNGAWNQRRALQGNQIRRRSLPSRSMAACELLGDSLSMAQRERELERTRERGNQRERWRDGKREGGGLVPAAFGRSSGSWCSGAVLWFP